MSTEAVFAVAGIVLIVYGILGRKVKGVEANNYRIFTEPLDLWQRLVLTAMGCMFLMIVLRPFLGFAQPLPAEPSTIISSPSPTSQTFTEPGCVLEDFENGMQLTWWSPDSDVFLYNLVNEQSYHGNQSLWVSYHKTNSYQFIGAELPLGLCDFTKFRTLQVWVYGEVNLLLKLEDQSLKQADVSQQYASELAGWSLLKYDYSTIESKIDLNKIKSIFFFPAPGDRIASGVFYLDWIALDPYK